MPQSDNLNFVHDEVDLRSRIQAEFSEMPGLKLTLVQASRLFGIDSERCRRALDQLVQGGALYRRNGAFLRPGTGRSFV